MHINIRYAKNLHNSVKCLTDGLTLIIFQLAYPFYVNNPKVCGKKTNLKMRQIKYVCSQRF